MAMNFSNRLGQDSMNTSKLVDAGNLTSEERRRLELIAEEWNFYEGFHWEGVGETDSTQVTFNYCRTFVNKFVSFEFGKGFTIKTSVAQEDKSVTTNDKKIDVSMELDPVTGEVNRTEEVVEKTALDFLNGVWDSNKRDILALEIGQTKSVTGEAWVKVDYESPEDMHDPFEEYPDGKMKLSVIPTQYCYPVFNQHNKEVLEELLIMYPISKEKRTGILRSKTKMVTEIYKEFWTKDQIIVYEGNIKVDEMENPYGIIPFVQIKNFPIAGRDHGISDLDDIIPLNTELNTKRSDISEIIDYHSAPVTMIFGAKIGNLEKGANKVWGGLPKDAKVSNLELKGDLVASNTYAETVKTAMCEIGAVPETVLGGASAISNTSGVALQYMNLPLIEKTRVKRLHTKEGFELVNKMILHIALIEELITIPENMSKKDFLYNDVNLPDTLPKDDIIELQLIQQEMLMGLECRHGAMDRLGKEDILNKLAEIDRERAEHPELFNPMLASMMLQNTMSNINSGMTNGQTAVEQVRVETTGQNGGATV